MGIKHLNKFFRDTCSNEAIRFISLSEIRDKRVVIDASIYLYKFQEEGALIENIFLMISMFRQYNITPIFVFDGKSPTEKKELVEKRYSKKVSSKKEFDELGAFLQENEKDLTYEEKQELTASMDSLKKRFVSLNRETVDLVKQLISACGVSYYQAQGEADVLCAALVIQKKAWACLSEDMDMFVYGTTRVLRYFSLQNHNAVLYDLDKILNELGISQQELREICVLSGTDYMQENTEFEKKENKRKCNLYNVLKWFKRFHKQQKQTRQKKIEKIEKTEKTEKTTLYEFVVENDYIQDDIDIERLMQIDHLFASSAFIKEDEISSLAYVYHNKHKNTGVVKDILEKDGFLFAPQQRVVFV